MSLEQLESAVLALNIRDRAEFANWFEQNKIDLLAGAMDPADLAPDQEAEILARRESARANPATIEPWEGTIDRARSRLNELRHSKESAR